MLNKPFKGAGTILIRERAAGVGFDEFGNCSALTFAINETKETQTDYRTPNGGNVVSTTTIDDITGSITGLSYQPDVLAIALRGLITKVDATPVVDEPITVAAGKTIKLNKLLDKSVPVTITVDATELTEGTDFTVIGSMIRITGYTPTGDTADALISYTPKSYYKVKALGGTTLEYEIIFNGYNTADNDQPVTTNIWRAKFSAATALDLINDSYGELPIEFEVLADETASDPENRFFEMNITE